MNVLPLSQASGRTVGIEWWQAGETAPIDCTGFTCTVADTSLPFTPTITPVNLAQGKFRMEPFTDSQRSQLKLGRQYGLVLVLRNSAEDAIQDLRIAIEIS